MDDAGLAVAGLVVGALGVVVAFLAWRFPASAADRPAMGAARPRGSYPPARRVGPIYLTSGERLGFAALATAGVFCSFMPVIYGNYRGAAYFAVFSGVYALLGIYRFHRTRNPGPWTADLLTTVLLVAATFYLTGGALDMSAWPAVVAALAAWIACAVWSAQVVRDRRRA